MSEQRIGLVIGANRGIGRAFVEALARHWGDTGQVYATARTPQAAQALGAELAALGLDVRTLTFDLAASDDAARVAAELGSAHGGVDLVLQNGAYAPSPARRRGSARDDRGQQPRYGACSRRSRRCCAPTAARRRRQRLGVRRP